MEYFPIIIYCFADELLGSMSGFQIRDDVLVTFSLLAPGRPPLQMGADDSSLFAKSEQVQRGRSLRLSGTFGFLQGNIRSE